MKDLQNRTTIYDDTPIIPEIVADTVVDEVAAFTNTELPRERYSKHLSDKAERIYKANATFAKKILAKGNKGRDTLYVFMRHWLTALLKEENPLVFHKLPQSFWIGHPLA